MWVEFFCSSSLPRPARLACRPVHSVFAQLRATLSRLQAYCLVARLLGRGGRPLFSVSLIACEIATCKFRAMLKRESFGKRLDGNSYTTYLGWWPSIRFRRSYLRTSQLLHTDAAIWRIDSHSPSSSAKKGVTISTGDPKPSSSARASSSSISCRRDGTSAGFESVPT